MTELTAHGWALAYYLAASLRSRIRGGDDAGVSTLEMVIIALGLMAIAAILVAALTAAVTRRTDQIQ